MYNIAFDLDGVICDTETVYWKYILEKYNHDIRSIQPPARRYEIEIPGVPLESVHIEVTRKCIRDTDTFGFIKLFPYVYDTLNFIHAVNGCPINIITARNPIIKEATETYLKRMFPGINFRIYFKDCHEKIDILKEINTKIFVEDRYKTVCELVENNSDFIQTVFLVNRPWNEGRPVPFGVNRINHLYEILRID